MGYYPKKLTPDASCLVLLLQTRIGHKSFRPTMVMSGGIDIYKKKVLEVSQGLDLIRTYLCDIFVLSKGNYTEQLDKYIKPYI